MDAFAIRLTDVSKRYGTRMVLDGVSLEAAAGETVALVGPSGGGKSTLLRTINALTEFEQGEVHVGPHRLQPWQGRAPASAVTQPIRRLVGMVFQDFQLFPHLTATDNVAIAPQLVEGAPRDEARAAAAKLLERIGLAERAGAYPHQLSGGQKQRVAIARALAMRPRALLCDEITSALDPELKHEVLDVLADLKRDGMTLLLVTHEIGFARRAADRVVMFEAGRVIEQGPPDQVLGNPTSDRARKFLAALVE